LPGNLGLPAQEFLDQRKGLNAMTRHADVVFQGGNVFDGIRLLSPETAVAVVGDKIAAVIEGQ
jgi:hypothetical protein